MAAGKKLTQNEFIARAKEIHGDKYDYSKVEYKNSKTPVCIICSEHGEFWQRPDSHLHGQGCMECGGRNKMTTETFITKARKVHGDKYDYSKVEYVNNHTKVTIICPEHGPFQQSPMKHLVGRGCPHCGVEARSKTRKSRTTLDDFIKQAKEVHGDKYDYSKVVYNGKNAKVCIVCPEHGPFWQTPSRHLSGRGCQKCHGNFGMTTEDFIAKAKEVHGDKYDYSKVEYVNTSKKVCIICPEHGPFWQLPHMHLKGQGCIRCAMPNYGITTEEYIAKAKKIHGDKYDYSNTEYVDAKTDICIICPEHGPFWQRPSHHLDGCGCPICNVGFNKEYKFNLLEEFEDEYAFRAFLANNDINILQVILRNVEPKFEPLKRDIERALANADEVDPIQSLEQKYGSDSEDENETETTNETATEATTINTIDLDDDDAVNAVLTTESDTNDDTDNETEPSIEEVVRNNEQELRVINRIEHMLTPEDREYIMEKFLNDKRRAWMAERENKLNK